MGTSQSNNSERFTVDMIPKLENKVIVITDANANAGIGFATAMAFASKSPGKLIITGRNESKIKDAVTEIKKKYLILLV